MYKRLIKLEKELTESFFLWGPRKSGKSTLLKATYPNSKYIDLLDSQRFTELTTYPHRLRQELEKSQDTQVIIDEIQKVPALLDEVHWLIENRGIKFGLCGSSARKVKRGHANLLGGRAIRFEISGLVSKELGDDFDISKVLNRGTIPHHYLSPKYERLLRAYTADYIKEEIAAEALTRNIPAFSNFLEVAALSDSEPVNYTTIGRDCGVKADTVQNYYQILTDTMMGRFVPSFTKRPKRKVVKAPKFYFFDVGVVGQLAKRRKLEPGSELWGKAFENWLYHEINSYSQYSESFFDIFYWSLASKIEVDFILGDMEIAIEAKSSKTINKNHLKGLRSIILDHPNIKRRIVVSMVSESRRTEDGIEILSYRDFLDELWDGMILS